MSVAKVLNTALTMLQPDILILEGFVYMKKFISSIVLGALTVCSLFSCGDNSDNDGGSGKPKKKEKSENSIVGKWKMDNLSAEGIESGGLIFSADGNGSIYEDSSALLHFQDDGLNVGGTVISKDYFTEEGDKLTIEISGQQMLDMKKVDVKDGYNGKYELTGGILYDTMTSSLNNKGFGENNLITISFNDNKSEVVFENFFTYKVDGSKLIISGDASFLQSQGDEVKADFTIENDKLTIKDSNRDNVLTRVSE